MRPASFDWRGSLRRPAGWCVAGPGTMTRSTRARHIATTTRPTIATTIWACGWCGRPTSLSPFTAQPDGCLHVRLSRACSLASLARAVLPVLAADYGLWPEAKVIKMAQVSPVRTGSVRQARRAYTQARRLLGIGLETPHVAFIHPPSKRPSSATMVLTCWYCPSFSQCQWCARRR